MKFEFAIPSLSKSVAMHTHDQCFDYALYVFCIGHGKVYRLRQSGDPVSDIMVSKELQFLGAVKRNSIRRLNRL